MSIRGTSYPKFTDGTTEVLLRYATLDPDFSVPDEIMFQSILNAKRTYAKSTTKAEFNVTVNLFEYENPETKLAEIQSHVGALVRFFPHHDGGYMGTDYYLSYVRPFALFSAGTEDVCLIHFIAAGEVMFVSIGYLKAGQRRVKVGGRKIRIKK